MQNTGEKQTHEISIRAESQLENFQGSLNVLS